VFSFALNFEFFSTNFYKLSELPKARFTTLIFLNTFHKSLY